MMHHWRNPYITDGLIAMFDGEWNAGGGVHDPNATTWKDLVGGLEQKLIGAIRFGENYIEKTAEGGGTSGLLSASLAATLNGTNNTIEVVYSCVRDGNNQRYRLGSSGTEFMWTNGSNYWAVFYYSGSALKYILDVGKVVGNNVIDAFSLARNGGAFIGYNKGIKTREKTGENDVGTVASEGSTYKLISDAEAIYNVFQSKTYSVRIYNRALTAAEVAANYAIDKKRFNLP